jgi:hypothetical protein
VREYIGTARGALGVSAFGFHGLGCALLGQGRAALGRRRAVLVVIIVVVVVVGRDGGGARGLLARAVLVAVLAVLAGGGPSRTGCWALCGLGSSGRGLDRRAFSRRGTWSRISRTLGGGGEARIPRVAAQVDVGGHRLVLSRRLVGVQVLGPLCADIGLGGGRLLAQDVDGVVAAVAVVRVAVLDPGLVLFDHGGQAGRRTGKQRWWGDGLGARALAVALELASGGRSGCYR